MKRSTTSTWITVIAAGWAGGCGGSKSGATSVDPRMTQIACHAAHCAQSSYLRAIPSRDTLNIRFGKNGTGTSGQGLASGTGRGSSKRALSAVSPVYTSIEDYVGHIDDEIDRLISHLEDLAGTEPAMSDPAENAWRDAPSGETGLDEVLDVKSADEKSFDLVYSIGPTGFTPAADQALITGTIQLDDSGAKTTLQLVIDLDAWTRAEPDFDAHGKITIKAMPFDHGELELWYDFESVAFGSESPVTSITTYWVFADDSFALEYIAEVAGHQGTAYARWDSHGGRYDEEATYSGSDGMDEEVATDCWGQAGAQSFDAEASLDAQGKAMATIDGSESSCTFGPIADHPNPGDHFDKLPQAGDWSMLAQQGS
jgi:hypothetical protein